MILSARPCLVAIASVLVSACATTHDPGWQGQGATPFDRAQAECRLDAASASPGTRESTMEACMARHGWHRGGG